ncbi:MULTISPECIES: NAD-dependent epimerase/dehydratase family protein [Janibacter]|uniref:NAD-dependent epimerase/dehydratase family protein n=1 Tax=Janibacter TaxID=53457 RepID=UPI0021A59498|nr:NAD-dependent epimerase/dehydratase family protein [Janibacter hoylei]MCT2292796.1 NAD-dependent epimerase/dehydratase family protein [Janibacter hoylei]
MPETVLVAGVSRHLGGAFARRLSRDESVGRIIGVDVVPPRHGIGRAEFMRADIRSPLISRIISGNDVDTVVHMGVIATPRAGGGRATQKEINVIGTMQLLAACQRAESVTKLIVKSTAGVYGSSPRDPAMFTEDMSAKRMPGSGWARDSVEVEGYVRGLSRRREDIEITTLRFANVIGPRIRTAFTDHFSLPVIPIPFGFDARLQFVHEDDCVAAIARAVSLPGLGAVNVAGDGIITVSQAANIAGRPYVLVPRMATGSITDLAKRFGLMDIGSDQVDLLSFGRGLDTRRMREDLGFEPAYTTRAAYEDFARATKGRVLDRLPFAQPGWTAVQAAETAMRAVTPTPESEK